MYSLVASSQDSKETPGFSVLIFVGVGIPAKETTVFAAVTGERPHPNIYSIYSM